MERNEFKESLADQMNRAREKERMQSTQRRIPSKVSVPMPKKIKPSIHEKQEQIRSDEIEEYCLKLLLDKKYAKESVEIIAQCMYEKNIRIDEYLIEDNSYEYSFTVYLVYMMILSGLFNEQDYLDAAELIINSAFEMKEIYLDMIERKNTK